jgi:hypothetical protein
MMPGGAVTDWNVYAPKWAPVTVVKTPGGDNKALELQDSDPYDYARAIRIFEEDEEVEIQFTVIAGQKDYGRLEVDVCDRYGNRPVRIHFSDHGEIQAFDGHAAQTVGHYKPGETYAFAIKIDATPYGSYDLELNGEEVLDDAALVVAVKSVERLSFRTGPYRELPNRKTDNEAPHDPLPGADLPVNTAVYHIDDVVVR